MTLEDFLRELKCDEDLVNAESIDSITIDFSTDQPNFGHTKVTYHPAGQVMENNDDHKFVRLEEKVSQRKVI